MFCSDPQQELMEKDVLRVLNQTSVNSPSGNNSVFESFLEDLCFWEGNELGNLQDGIGERRIFRSGRSRIPTMKEAIDMDNEYRDLTRTGSDDSEEKSPFLSATWKTAIDAVSGKIYYYDAISRKTQWKKPSRLKTVEKEKKRERRRISRQFFNEMEKNIVDSMSRGEVIPGIQFIDTKKEGPPKEPFPKSHVRTISAMHGVLLEELGTNLTDISSRQDQHKHKQKCQKEMGKKGGEKTSAKVMGRPPLPGRNIARSSSYSKTRQLSGVNGDGTSSPKGMEQKVSKELNSKFSGDNFLTASNIGKSSKRDSDDPKVSSKLSVGHTRRNTEGTIYLQNTMTNPDIKATIKCICGVYRAHIRQSKEDEHGAQKKKAQSSLNFDVFDDDFNCSRRRRSLTCPTLTEISEFYEIFYQRSQMEHDTIIFSLIYVERLIKSTNGILAPSPQNWRSLLFSCMVLASKVWDDLSMWNYDFANVTAHTTGLAAFTIYRINELELALLKCLKFSVKVPASEYAKYYFLIRTTLLQSGLVKEDGKPLDKKTASGKLETLTSLYFGQRLAKDYRDRRSKSMDGSILNASPQERSGFKDPGFNGTICLRPLVR